MPFRDPEWEDFQRDCDFFPAFTDYIFGVDNRPEAADEPGLHPQVYDRPPPPPPPPLPRQRLHGLHPPAQHPLTYDPVRNAAQTRSYSMPKLRSTSLLQQESSMESMQPTPCPAPRGLPPTSAPPPLLRPNELTVDPQYLYISPLERLHTDTLITQAWSVMNSDAIPTQKVKAMSYIRSVSNVAAVKRREYHARQTLRLQSGQESKGHDATLPAQMLQQYASLQFSGALSSMFQEDVFAVYEYAVHDISQLPAYMQSRLPQLWACTEATLLRGPLKTPEERDYFRQAAQHMMSLIFSVPPKWRRYTQVVMNAMIKLHKQGGDPMTMFHHLPRVEEVFGIQQKAQPQHTRTQY